MDKDGLIAKLLKKIEKAEKLKANYSPDTYNHAYLCGEIRGLEKAVLLIMEQEDSQTPKFATRLGTKFPMNPNREKEGDYEK